MRRGSIRRPIFLYAAVVVMALVATLVTVSSFSVVRVAQRALLESAERRAIDIASSPDPVLEVQRQQARGHLVAIARSDLPGLGVSFKEARQAAGSSDPRSRYVTVPLTRTAMAGAYVIVFVEGAETFDLARREIRSVLVLGSLAGLVASLVLAFFVGRLVLSPLSALEKFAAEGSRDEELVREDAPHEVAEVAQTFQRTLRDLKSERDRIHKQHGELERMQASLIRAEKLASVGRLAAGVAHEIGNPLAAVLGYLALLRRGLDADSTQDVLERCTRELKRMHETIKKLLQYARHDESEEVEAVATRAILSDAVMLLRGHPALLSVSLDVDLGEGSDPDALASAQAISQIIVNLVVNAGHAVRAVPEPRVEVRRRWSFDQIEIEVSDNGPGIREELREQIFDPFFTTKSPGEGTGLGLAVSRSLAEAMGADLSLSETQGGGARFVLRLAPLTRNLLPKPLG